MRHRSPLRLTSGSRRRGRIASSGVCVTLALLPSLWVSWQAPAARGVVLPALAILTLLLLLPRSRNEGEPGRGPKSGQTRRTAPDLSEIRTALWDQVHALTAYP